MDKHPCFLFSSSKLYSLCIASKNPSGAQGHFSSIRPPGGISQAGRRQPIVQRMPRATLATACPLLAPTLPTSHTPGICPWTPDQKLWSGWRGRELQSCLLPLRSHLSIGIWCRHPPQHPRIPLEWLPADRDDVIISDIRNIQ